MRIAVTGSTGFVGSALVSRLRSDGHEVLPVPRSMEADLAGVDAVVHLAAIAHRTGDTWVTPDEFERVNHGLTRKLADSAAESSVRRFVFVSSVYTVAGHPGVLSPDLDLRPVGAYGASKARAEAALRAMPEIGPVILRPPLVYGRGAKGNLAALRRLALTPWPLPFGLANNRRTMVSISNLVSAIAFAVAAEDIEGRIFHVTDGRDLSVREIVSKMRIGAGLAPRLLPIPPALGKVPLVLAGKKQMAEQLFGDLIVDGSALNEVGWRPPYDPDVDLKAMGAG